MVTVTSALASYVAVSLIGSSSWAFQVEVGVEISGGYYFWKGWKGLLGIRFSGVSGRGQSRSIL